MKTKTNSDYTLDEEGVKLAMKAIEPLVKSNNKMVFNVDLGSSRIGNFLNFRQLQEELDSVLINDYDGAYTVTVYQFASAKELKPNFEYYFKKKLGDIIKKNTPTITEDDNESGKKRLSPEELGAIVQREVENSLNGFKLEYQFDELKKQHKILEEKYERLKRVYNKAKQEHYNEIEALEEDLEKLESKIKDLQDQANLGKNIMEGVKMGLPQILAHPKVGAVLDGLLPKDTNYHQEEEDGGNYTEEEEEVIEFILDAKEQFGDDFHNVKNIVAYLLNNPEMIQETVTMYQLHEEDKAAKVAMYK
jgi:DNA repair exonuclease SbcCD ATPase subunit